MRILSVTEVLRLSGLMDTTHFNGNNLDLGTQVHAALTLFEKGILNEEVLDPRLTPFIESWKKLKILLPTKMMFVDTRFEQRIANIVNYSGTPDWVGTVRDMFTVIEFKTGVDCKWHKYQRAAYANLWVAEDKRPAVMGVNLNKHGELATIQERGYWDMAQDFGVFVCALTVEKAKMADRGE